MTFSKGKLSITNARYSLGEMPKLYNLNKAT